MPLEREVPDHEGSGYGDKLRIPHLDVCAMFSRDDRFSFREPLGVFGSRIAHV